MGNTFTLVKQFGNPTFNSLIVTGNTNLSGSISIGPTTGTTGMAGTVRLSVVGALTVGENTNGTAVIDAYSSFAYYGCNTAANGMAIGPTGAAVFSNSVSATSFSGAGTGLTGTAASLSIGGNAANITAYTINQNLGTSNSPSFDQVLATNNGNGTNFKVGDDAWIGDVNAANTIRVKGQQDATAGYITFGNQVTQLGLTNSTTLTWGAAFTATGNVTAFSDRRVKENIKTIDNALAKVLCLRGVTYNRTDLEDKSEQIGVIAQEVKEILPQVVIEENDRYSVAYGNIVGVLIEAIKEQQAQIEELKSRL